MIENVDKLRALYDAFARRDLDAAVERMDPEVELRPAIVGIDSRSLYRGRQGCKEFLETLSVWERQWVEFKEVIEAPGDRILVVEVWHTRGRDDINVDFEVVDVYTFRDGLVVRVDGFRDKDQALKAVVLAD
jgi:ketosteroid isomerase-like protein